MSMILRETDQASAGRRPGGTSAGPVLVPNLCGQAGDPPRISSLPWLDYGRSAEQKIDGPGRPQMAAASHR